jgi:saccharopine dehydrogenase-like NADP-dependent oxidoreductase
VPPRIVILGGYGAFGARVARRLARLRRFDLVIAGRSEDKACAAAADLGAQAVRMDGRHVTAGELRALAPQVLINASGPFQDQDYALALACIAAGVHYCDLADARAFAVGIGVLDAAAKAAGVLVVSGASTVPAVSAAVVDRYAPQFARLRAITSIIAPGKVFAAPPARCSQMRSVRNILAVACSALVAGPAPEGTPGLTKPTRITF